MNDLNEGYLRHPSIHKDTVAFVCEDSLWTASIKDGSAARLTHWPGEVRFPRISPDGKWIAFTSTKEDTANLYVIPAAGGEARRLTWHNAATVCAGWTPDSRKVLFRSSMASPTPRETRLFTAALSDGAVAELPVGPAITAALHPDSRRVVIGRNYLDPAGWKRYRGGLCGVLWSGDLRAKTFRKLVELPGNAVSPMWVGGRVFFLSDHEDHGNIYSVKPDGSDLKRHTHHMDFYARFPCTDGRRIVYQKAAELWLLDPSSGERRLRIRTASAKTGLARKFVSASRYLTEYGLDPKGSSCLLTSRGKPFALSHWEGAVRQLGLRQGVRYRLSAWLHDGKRVLTVSDEGGEERLEVWDSRTGLRLERLDKLGTGFLWELSASPKEDKAAACDERNRLHLIDLKKGTSEVIDSSAVWEISDLAWSGDGRCLAYAKPERTHGEFFFGSSIKVYDLKTGKSHSVTDCEFHNRAPVFDPEGRYLAFLSYRHFNPVMDSAELNATFYHMTKPYLVTLKASEYSPLFPMPKPEQKAGAKKGKPKETVFSIDFDGIADRVEEVPVKEGDYARLAAVKGKLLLLCTPKTGMLGQDWTGTSDKPSSSIEAWDFANRKHDVVCSGVSDFALSANGEKMLIRVEKRLRVVKAGDKPPADSAGENPGPESGWLDLSRIRLEIEPAQEWRQIYRQAWRDQRDFFWTRDLAGVDWKGVRDRYLPLLDKVATRAELSDLLWDMQGELNTSHAYEFGGDYAAPPAYRIGLLGADLERDPSSGRVRFKRIYRGDSWIKGHGSPLRAPGVNVKEGDYLLAVDGVEVKAPLQPHALLAHRVDCMVTLRVGASPDPAKAREVTVRTLSDESKARYREWVRANRELVKEHSGGRLGYIHIPDMSCQGLIEFHRALYTESAKDGLIVDVRFNGGGFVSGMIVSKLARRPVGYGRRRSGLPVAYPEHAVRGPIVAICDERCGSDGDIFSQAFKALKLGVLVGKRTWGGVVGIDGRRRFVDQGLATQPEYAFWFHGAGWGVENRGVDPDIEVEWDPASFAAGEDPQLEKAVEVAMERLKTGEGGPPDLGPAPSKAPRPLTKYAGVRRGETKTSDLHV
ncbi:MAG: PDZ domain-containing protein [Elusimicrobia bacterium]|nr:PDZ domain-containing protein [Elusimicrobiota bacterium]